MEDSEDEGRAQEVSSTNQTPALSGQLLPEHLWALGGQDIWHSNTFQLSAFMERRRHLLQSLMPPSSDRVNVTAPQLGPSVNNVIGWTQGLLQHAHGQPLYTPPRLPEMPMDGRFMFPLQGFNPLAQVRQFGELNRCSDFEVPLSLVKKMKPQCNMMSSDGNNNSEPQNFRQSPKNIRLVPVPGNLQNAESLPHRHIQLPAGHVLNDANIGLANARSAYNRLVPDIGVMPGCSGDISLRTNYQVPGEDVSGQGREMSNPKHARFVGSNTDRFAAMNSLAWRSGDIQNATASTRLATTQNNQPSPLLRPFSPGLPKPEVILRNSHLWATTQEVVLSSSGRPMFPLISLSVSQLHPDQQYSISLKIALCSNDLYEYRGHQWVPFLKVPGDATEAVYPHPDSPKNGRQWGSEVIFDKLRLSSQSQGKNVLKLQLRRQYLPHVIIQTETELWEFPLKDAVFITVKIDRSSYLVPGMRSPEGPSASGENLANQADSSHTDQSEDEEVPQRNQQAQSSALNVTSNDTSPTSSGCVFPESPFREVSPEGVSTALRFEPFP